MQTVNEEIRKCGNSWKHCNGNCDSCGEGSYTATTSTDSTSTFAVSYDADDLGKPTKEAYEKAIRDREFALTSLRLCRKRRDELIDALSKERDSEKFYMELYEKRHEIIRKYEIYEELENNR